MKEKMIQYIQRHQLLSHGDKIVLGVSGGADSVCLLHLLQACRKEWELSLLVVHIQHGIRGAEALEDAAFVRELAARYSLPFFLVEGDVPALAGESGMSEEEAGRKFRYEQLERIRREEGADLIAVAHHRDDQAETVLFNLFRGSGARGLSGMTPRRGRIVRPLLFTARQQIETYLRQQGYEWREDSTNRDTVYSRNRIRRELLPWIEETINSQAGQHIAAAAADIAKWRTYVEKMARQAASGILVTQEGEERLYLKPFREQDEVIQDELLRCFLERGIPGMKDVSRTHFRQVRELIRQETGKQLHLPQGTIVIRDYDCLRLASANREGWKPVRRECRIPSVNIVEMDGVSFRLILELKNREDLVGKIPEKDYTKWFDYDKIINNPILRSPEEGDFFVMDKEGHRKRLARYYIDQKIARDQRGRQLVLADGSHVMWAFPDRISEDYKINKSTKRVLVATKERIRHERRNQNPDQGRGDCCESEGAGRTDQP